MYFFDKSEVLQFIRVSGIVRALQKYGIFVQLNLLLDDSFEVEYLFFGLVFVVGAFLGRGASAIFLRLNDLCVVHVIKSAVVSQLNGLYLQLHGHFSQISGSVLGF